MRFYLLMSLFALFLVSCTENDLLTPNEEETEEPIPEAPVLTFEQAMLQAINEVRRSGNDCGGPVDTLSWDSQLAAAAERHAQDMFDNDFFDHQGSDSSSVGMRVTAAGYDWMAVAENIAWGYTSIEAVMQGWQDSPGHCANMMSDSYTQVGVARVGNYWVQVFARP